MPIESGPITFRRFAVEGNFPKTPEPELLDRLAAYVLEIGEHSVPDATEYGWSGGRHVFDATFSFEHNVFADALAFAMRIDTNRVPAEVRRAYQIMEEDAAAAEGSGRKRAPRDAKQAVRDRVDQDLKSGKYRRSKLVPLLWDLPTGMIYTSASGKSLEKLHELFTRTFDGELLPLSAGALAHRRLESTGHRRDYEDFRPTRFAAGPDGERQAPEYPWVTKGDQAKDFLGNEFLLWLWYTAEHNGGQIATPSAGEVTILFERVLELDCAFGFSGRDLLRGTDPTQMPEARDALRTGKVPRRAGIRLEAGGGPYAFTFQAEQFLCTGVKLPDVEADTPRVAVEERIALLRDLSRAIDGLFDAFLKVRASSKWEPQTSEMRRWIRQPARTPAVVAAE